MVFKVTEMFKSLKIWVAVLSTVIVSGCALNQKKMTREEFLQVTRKTYQEVTPEQIFEASERLFILTDGDDFNFQHTPDSLIANRPWSIYMVLAATSGTDAWVVKATKNPDTGLTDASVFVTIYYGGGMSPMFMGNSASVVTSPAGGGTPPLGTATYKLFWDRLDYLLGKTPTWTTCEDIDNAVASGEVWGDAGPLCNVMNIKDQRPDVGSAETNS